MSERPLRLVRIGLGSNSAAAVNLARARAALAADPDLQPVHLSDERSGPAVAGGVGVYVNQLLTARTGLASDELNARLKALEAALGRVRDGSGVVAIDLDLLAVEGEFEEPELRSAPHWRALL